MENLESTISSSPGPKDAATTALGKCLLCHVPQSDETLEGMVRFVTYPSNHTPDGDVRVLRAEDITPLVISANNMTNYKIINKSDLKNKNGTSKNIMDALSYC